MAARKKGRSTKGGRRPRGRPSGYSDAIADRICEEIGTSLRGLDRVCRESDQYPTPRTAWRWLAQYDSFRQKYARAKERQAHLCVEEGVDILDGCTPGGAGSLPTAQVMLARERATYRRWLAGRLAPKVYGEKLELGGEVAVRGASDLVRLADED